MIQIQYEGLDNNLQAAVRNVNLLFQSSEFYETIRKHSKFDLANVPPGWIADLLEAANLNLQVEFYFTIHPYSKAITCDNPKNPEVIYMNRWNINKPVAMICTALMHQCIHAANSNFSQYYFGHGDNNMEGKENTAPIWISELAQKMVSKGHLAGEAVKEEVCEYSSTASLLLQVKLQNSTLFQTCH